MFNNLINDILQYTLIIVYAITIISTIVLIIIENREPYKAISWLIVLILLPVVGFILYLLFGQNFRKNKIITKKSIRRLKKKAGFYDIFQKNQNINSIYLQDKYEQYRKIIRLLYNNSSSVLYSNNAVKLLINGTDTFNNILADLKKASTHIHLEYYIFENDEIGNKVKEILISKAKEGVEIRVLIDDVGSWQLKKPFIKEMKNVGIEVFSFLEVRFPFLTKKINYRNHRKILVIDGKIGYTGGINIADRYINGIKKGKNWRDTHIRIEGDAVKGLQSVFLVDWFFVSQKELIGAKYFPKNETIGYVPIQISSCSPDSDWESIMQAYISSFLNAQKNIFIHTPYFMPTESILNAMKIAALSGIDIKLILPKQSDSLLTKTCTRSYINELLEAGVKVFYYNKGFLHSKAIVIDEMLSSIGTLNMDIRSFEHNFEVNAFIYDKAFAMELVNQFRRDLSDSLEIKLINWKKRPIAKKFVESIARLLSPLL